MRALYGVDAGANLFVQRREIVGGMRKALATRFVVASRTTTKRKAHAQDFPDCRGGRPGFRVGSAGLQTPAMHAAPPEPFKYMTAKEVTALTDKPGPGSKTDISGP